MIFFRFACITSAISHEFFSITHLGAKSPVLINQNQSLAFLLTGSFIYYIFLSLDVSRFAIRRHVLCSIVFMPTGADSIRCECLCVPRLSEIKYSEARNEKERRERGEQQSDCFLKFFDNIDDDDDLSSSNGRSLMSMPFLSFFFFTAVPPM